MQISVFMLVLLGYSLRITESGKHVHLKIHIPHHIHKHKHVQTVYKEPKVIKKVIVHKHEHNHGHGHDHKHDHGHKHDHKHKHKHHHEKQHDHHHHHDKHHNYDKHHNHHQDKHQGHHDKHHDYGWSHHNFGRSQNLVNPPMDKAKSVSAEVTDYYPFDDGYEHSKKTFRSEKVHLQEVKNSQSGDPIDQHFITGSYKVSETPNEHGATRYDKIFEAPLANLKLQKSTYEVGEPASNEHDDNGGEEEYDFANNDEDNNSLGESGYADSYWGNPQHSHVNMEAFSGNDALNQYFGNGI